MYPGDPSLERCFSLLHHWERFTWVSTGDLPIQYQEGACGCTRPENTAVNSHMCRGTIYWLINRFIISLGKVHLHIEPWNQLQQTADSFGVTRLESAILVNVV